jgi:cytochrome c553
MLSLMIPGITLAEYDTIDHLMAQLDQKLQDKKQNELAVTKGKYRAELCQHCHGKDGNSLRDYIPNLAAQNAQYLLTQFEFFRLGKRKDYVMGNLAKTMNEDDRVNLALYYSNQKVNIKVTFNSDSNSKQMFDKMCVSCHGKKGYGNKDLPRIAGQPDKFIIKTLTAYRDNTSRRPNSPMLGIAATLSSEDIKGLASYISTMN